MNDCHSSEHCVSFCCLFSGDIKLIHTSVRNLNRREVVVIFALNFDGEHDYVNDDGNNDGEVMRIMMTNM